MNTSMTTIKSLVNLKVHLRVMVTDVLMGGWGSYAEQYWMGWADGWSCTVLYGSTNTFIINLRTQRVSEGVQIAA